MTLLGPDGGPIEDAVRSEAEELRLQLREAVADRRLMERQAEQMAYAVLDMPSTQDMTPRERIQLAKVAREVWAKDPQAGAAFDMQNEFVFGRGVPKPRCKSHAVQKVIDEAWMDPDNQLVLTSFSSLAEKGLDLATTSNVFFTAFADGDGRVKLSCLEHDSVRDVVRDPDNRLRILYYVAVEKRSEWDFDHDRARVTTDAAKTRYYEHWRNVDVAREEGRTVPTPPSEKVGEGKVYHLATNKLSEMAFGVPTMRRLMRWFSAYNEFMSSRVDVTKAAAAFIMKRRVKGGQAAVQRTAAQVLNRRSELASSMDDDYDGATPPRPGSLITENESAVHEALNLSTNAGNAQTDGQMIRSQISAATHWPQHYLGDVGSANLATATSMELPVLKHVEALQEVWEGCFRWFADLVIAEADKAGTIDWSEDNERLALGEADGELADGETLEEQRDLTYEFALPSPLKRQMAEYINAVVNVAKCFDPNGTNNEFTRLLLGFIFHDGLEVEDPAELVDRAFPKGYVDPMMQAAMAGGGPEEITPRGVPGQQPNQVNPYGPPSQASSNTPATFGDASGNPNNQRRGIRSRTPEEVAVQEATFFNRNGDPIALRETRFADLPPDVRTATQDAIARDAEELEREVLAELDAALADAEAALANGNGLVT